MKLINRDNGLIIALQIGEARSFWSRLKGLMFTRDLPPGCALHIRPCRSIHTFFMNYSIDVLHLDSHLRIVGMEQRLKPGKLGERYGHTVSVIELPAGSIEQTETRVGHAVHFVKNYNEEERLEC